MPEVPSGTATFLFTDVEGSTRLLKGLRERYGEVLAEHQRILREAFAAHGGEEVDTQGDSFFAAFRRAQDAVLAAADVQRGLAAHEWPEGGELRVRMGIHTGQFAISADRYLGVAVHRAARICAAGHGGQVLISQTTKGLLDDEEVELPGLEFRDLGEQRLKDLDRPIRLFQLAGEGLSDEFPPLNTLDTAPARGLTPFAGREEELAEATAAALGRRRLPVRNLAIAAVALALIVPLLAVVLAGRSGDDKPVVVRPNSVAVIDPEKNEVVANVAVGRDPAQLAYADGNVWVANSRDTTLSKISAETLEAAPPVGIAASEITDLAVGYKSVWLAAGRDGTVLRFDPTNDVLDTIHMPRLKNGTGVPSYIHAVAVGAGGVWVIDESQLTVFRVDPQTGKVDVTMRNAIGADVHGYGGGITCDPLRLATGLDRVWTIDPVSPSLVEINPQLRALGLSITLPASNSQVGDSSCLDPASFTVGHRAVWITSKQKEELWRVDPSTSSVSKTIGVGRGPLGVAAADDGIWVANRFDGTVTRVDPQTNEVVETITLGHLPSWVAVGGGRVWVSVQP
jgi:YVTN family beta-propeller protein